MKLLLLGLALSSAYEIPLSRRAVIARVTAAVPLAAVAAPAFAETNAYLTTKGPAKAGPSPAKVDSEEVKVVGRGAVVDNSGAAVQPSATTDSSAAFSLSYLGSENDVRD